MLVVTFVVVECDFCHIGDFMRISFLITGLNSDENKHSNFHLYLLWCDTVLNVSLI